jgi:hypothetical protein
MWIFSAGQGRKSRSRKPAGNSAMGGIQRKKDHLWMEKIYLLDALAN